MYITETELINVKLTANGKLNESDIIKYLIEDDTNHPKKKKMFDGERYYCAEHDIYNKDFRTAVVSETGITGEEELHTIKNPNRSNHHDVHPFHKILVDQKTAYSVGCEPTIVVKGAEKDTGLKEYETAVTDFADERFNERLQDGVTEASNCGYSVFHVYYDEQGKLEYCNIPAKECILVYDTKYQEKLEQVIRYYEIIVMRNGHKETRKRVEWWTAKNVVYYIENDSHQYVRDDSVRTNPHPHWWSVTSIDGMEKKREGHSWGRVPFVVLKNNSKGMTDLEAIKGLIDAYDLISSEGTNNFLDLVELYWMVAGYGGETAAAITKKLQINRAVSVSDPNGKVEAKQVSLPVMERIEWLKMLQKDIFHFGMGIDVDADKFGNAPSGVSLKFQYSLLDLKVNQMIPKLKRTIKELLWFFTDDLNRKEGTDYDSSLIDITINKSAVTNDLETVQIINQSAGVVSQKRLLAKHPFVDDVNEELKQLAAEAEEEPDPMRVQESGVQDEKAK